MVDRARRKAEAILQQFSGYPDLPNGRPSGVLAYMLANETRPVTFAQSGDGQVRRLAKDDTVHDDEQSYDIQVPYFDPSSAKPVEIYYATIETNPTGVIIASFPKGTQDAHAQKINKNGETDFQLTVEFGQKTQLVKLLTQIAEKPDLSEFASIKDVAARREAELNKLHKLTIQALLDYGCDVTIEPLFVTAKRETMEEHGFDFTREERNIVRVDAFVEPAISKRRPDSPIKHYVYAAHVTDFESTLPRISTITEEKNPEREGNQYFEHGTFMTLPQMRRHCEHSHQQAKQDPALQNDDFVQAELSSTKSRLDMLERIERTIVKELKGQGINVSSSVQDGPPARIMDTEHYNAHIADAHYIKCTKPSTARTRNNGLA